MISNKRLGRFLVPFALAAASCGVMTRGAAQQHSLGEYVQPALRDLSASIDIVSKNDRELEKIGKGYVDAYRLSSQEIWCKEPDRVRFQGKKGIFVVRHITNGGRRLMEVPTLHIHEVQDITKEPGKGTSISDLGLITRSWVDHMQSRWLREEPREGKTVQVFEVWYREDPGLRSTIVVDPATKTQVEQIDHHRDQRKKGYKKRLLFSDLKQVEGVWVPTKVTMYNTLDRVAAVMNYNRIKINSNLPDGLFTF